MADENQPGRHQPSWGERFFAGYFWLITKNLIGWTLILLSLLAGPLFPGPGGIPLFLIGFALVTFPGKRRLTARVLRGRRIRWKGRTMVLGGAGVALVVPALGLWIAGTRPHWLRGRYEHGLLARSGVYLLGVVIVAVALYAIVLLLNLLVSIMPPTRRRVRPWLRRHHIRLLPPRRRRRHPYEHGIGPLRLKDEILGIVKRPRS